MYKEIKYNENIIRLSSQLIGDNCSAFSISEISFNNDELKRFDFSIRYDITFNVYCEKEITNSISIEYDSNHPLYNYIEKLLGTDEKLIIEDDLTREIASKYISIKRADNMYIIEFVDKKTNDKPSCEISIFIKNIYPDPRSKIDDESKLRVVHFFRDVEKTLLKEDAVVFSNYSDASLNKNKVQAKVLKDNKK